MAAPYLTVAGAAWEDSDAELEKKIAEAEQRIFVEEKVANRAEKRAKARQSLEQLK